MISLIRLESDGKTLDEIVKDLDKATRQLGPFADELRIHDEHYERVHDSCYKGRRVFRIGEKSPYSGVPYSGVGAPAFYNNKTTATTVKT